MDKTTKNNPVVSQYISIYHYHGYLNNMDFMEMENILSDIIN